MKSDIISIQSWSYPTKSALLDSNPLLHTLTSLIFAALLHRPCCVATPRTKRCSSSPCPSSWQNSWRRGWMRSLAPWKPSEGHGKARGDLHMYMYIYIIYMYSIYVYIYICIVYVYIYICIYIYMYTYLQSMGLQTKGNKHSYKGNP